MQDLSSLLPGMMDVLPDSFEVRQALVFGAWKKAAGESLANHSAPVELSEDVLHVAVSNENWLTHLKEISPKLIFKVNNVLRNEVVRRIEFSVDESRFDIRPPRERQDLSGIELEEALAQKIEEIRDPELRESVADAAKLYLHKLKDGR